MAGDQGAAVGDAGSQAAVKSLSAWGSLVCCSSCSPGQSPVAGSSPRKTGRKRRLQLSPTALGLAYGRSVHDRFIHSIPSHPTLWVRLNQFVVVILGSFVSPLINNGVTGQLSCKPPGACARTRGDLRARQYGAY